MTNTIALPPIPPGYRLSGITPQPDGTFKYDLEAIPVQSAPVAAAVEPVAVEEPKPKQKAEPKTIPARLAASVAPPSAIARAEANAKKVDPVPPVAWSEIASVPDVAPPVAAALPAAIAAPASTDESGRGPDKQHRASPVVDVRERVLRCIAMHQRRNNKALAKEAYGNSGKAARKRVRSVLRNLERDGLIMEEGHEIWTLIPGADFPVSVQAIVDTGAVKSAPTAPATEAPVVPAEVEPPALPSDPSASPAVANAPPRGSVGKEVLALMKANPKLTRVKDIAVAVYGEYTRNGSWNVGKALGVLCKHCEVLRIGTGRYRLAGVKVAKAEAVAEPAVQTPANLNAASTESTPSGKKHPVDLGKVQNVAAHITAFLSENPRSSERHISLHIFGSAGPRSVHKTKARLRSLELSGLAAKDHNGLWVPAVKGVAVIAATAPAAKTITPVTSAAKPPAGKPKSGLYERGAARKVILAFLRKNGWQTVNAVAAHVYGAANATNNNRANTLLYTYRAQGLVVKDENNRYALSVHAKTEARAVESASTIATAPAKAGKTPGSGRKPFVTNLILSILAVTPGATSEQLCKAVYGNTEQASMVKLTMTLPRLMMNNVIRAGDGNRWYAVAKAEAAQ